MIPLYQTDGRSTCPLGMPMCQNRMAVPTWSYAMEVLPPARVIEIGSYNGAFATALGLHCKAIGAHVYSWDIHEPSESIVPIAEALGNVTFHRASCWDVESIIATLIAQPGVTLLLCDGGDKLRELETFARYLKHGDVIGAHDYDMFAEMPHDDAPALNDRPWQWCEIREPEARKIAVANDLRPWFQQHFDVAGWLVYRKAGA